MIDDELVKHVELDPGARHRTAGRLVCRYFRDAGLGRCPRQVRHAGLPECAEVAFQVSAPHALQFGERRGDALSHPQHVGEPGGAECEVVGRLLLAAGQPIREALHRLRRRLDRNGQLPCSAGLGTSAKICGTSLR